MKAARASVLFLSTLSAVASTQAANEPPTDHSESQAKSRLRDSLRDSLAALQGYVTTASSDIQGAVASVDWNELPASAQRVFQEAGASASEKVAAIDWEELPQHIQDWIKEHPYQTAFYVANGVVFLAPGLVTAPFLGVLGFSTTGPVAGTAAAGAQAAMKGQVIARGLFATLQSAGMGGYGAAVVAGGTQAGAAIAAGAAGAWNYFAGRKRDAGTGEPEGQGED